MDEDINTAGRGPLGVPTNSPVSDTGTSARIQNRPNVPVGMEGSPAHHPRSTPRIGGDRTLAKVWLPELQLGSKGLDVKRLQRLLNSRLDSDTKLKIDGIFGPKTRRAVIEFQKDSDFDLKPDGIAGRKTWFALISAKPQESKPKTKPAASPDKGGVVAGAAPPVSFSKVADAEPETKEESVDTWSQYERFKYVVTHVGSYLGKDLRAQYQAMLTAENIAFMVGTFVAAAVGSFFGISEIVGGVLFVLGIWLGGPAAIEAAKNFRDFLELGATGATTKELNAAAADLAKVITFAGVVGLFLLIHRLGEVTGAKLKTAKAGPPAGGAEPETEPKSPDKPAKAESDKTSTTDADRPAVGSSVTTLKSESTGATIKATPGKTTTVLGRYQPDMKSILGQLDAKQSTDFGPKPGGFNVLNVDAPDMPAQEFWETYNKPFLDQAIARGDNIALATKPLPEQLTTPTGNPTMFGREMSYLQANGYTYDPATNSMVK
ncbi:MAG TPA: peptidoglycan-binding domain-containing protein [Candidatus Dormibacteraeota bacterium]|nr:peptidoglycan-binding domain-containing protein [Candidatus Dormibacteraeota bacterium]